ncbi:phosphoribosylglycinamide formyltransferase [Nitrosospira multiformis]|uniref:Phosphoribosylglycinamide formyltransferase n=1 Tax=Nitrosospira multiformis (strain ATCC 25196 / NCIMB 11849 / C 71) TaxID=323848 RepID=Q2Y5R6_NITMU|nr:phosphoribosylglycinamide formyltransferase [Nitrosospira multiformis]ABB75905.1 formyltetrahydrofolate-dependent phosphoribosylglycinamide formyltransferase [Nitrosospira multiformis ATCC 25196]SEA17578.1 formyltetrahydrofolate-dependent phosphoribosylglycinamide formyltransferase [Nitrosospira multiformis]SEF99065.1 formyltetrahydrofolate-dependent phosphoribosylglycinamide formyltransferase [Nitrosospira multiformis ATCC 25196]
MKSLVILISGRGSNMQALMEANLPARIAAVISNKPEAPGLETARSRGYETIVLDPRSYPDREAFDQKLAEAIDAYAPDLVALAGFMRLLGDNFVSRYKGRLINIHPSLLPAFPGLHPHRQALKEGVKVHGCTVHFVTAETDRGPIIIQAAVQVMPDDTEETLAARVLRQEHRIYPEAVRWFMKDRLKLSDNSVEVSDADFDNSVLYSPGLSK